MKVDKEDVGLSLSLSLSLSFHHQNQACLMPLSLAARNPLQPSWKEALFPSDRNSESYRTTEPGSFLRGIDVNRLPSTGDCEDAAGVSSPNSTLSSVSGKRSERDVLGDEQDTERASSRGISDEEDGENSRKKLRLTKDQSTILEKSFEGHNSLNPKQKTALAKQLGLRPRQVEVWFQNRRARTKLKQTEVDCEFLKRCCDDLTEENRRLQKEVHELRALKHSPQLYMHMIPPTTLTLCPSCERVRVPPPASSNADHSRSHQMGPRPGPVNRWAKSATQIAHLPFDALLTRS